jgi:hypothetical protein
VKVLFAFFAHPIVSVVLRRDPCFRKMEWSKVPETIFNWSSPEPVGPPSRRFGRAQERGATTQYVDQAIMSLDKCAIG